MNWWKFEISSTAQSKNQLNWASCGLDQSIETIQSMGSINNQSTDRYSRWGPPSVLERFGGGRVWSCRLGGPPNRPARPPRQRALSPFFSLLPLWGGRCAARTLFFRTLNLHTVNWKRARSPVSLKCGATLDFCKQPSFFCLKGFKEATATGKIFIFLF